MPLGSLLILLASLSTIAAIPCPRECICRPIEITDVSFARLSYQIDCSNVALNNGKLAHTAEDWTLDADHSISNSDDNDITTDYAISIDLSNSVSLKKFTDNSIDLRGFSYSLRSLSLANQGAKFILAPDAFTSPVYENLQVLNLTGCCKQVPKQCPQLFKPLDQLQVLDLSGSELYRTCLDTPDPILPALRDLILRHNVFDIKTFSPSSELFSSVSKISGKLDLHNSLLRFDPQLSTSCLFEHFPFITGLDLSNVHFEPASNNTGPHLARLLQCETRKGDQLLQLSLRALKLRTLPDWFTNDRFPRLKQLDLSYNFIFAIDLQSFRALRHISLAYNPVEFNRILWRKDAAYDSINLRATVRYSPFDLTEHLTRLFELTKNIDYSDNVGENAANISRVPVTVDLATNQFWLKVSRAKIYAFAIDSNDITRLDVSCNSLTELLLDKQLKLSHLDCSNQFLQNLTFNPDLSELKELRCSNNSLTTVGNYQTMKKDRLQVLDLSFNMLETLKELFADFDGRYLRTVKLGSNKIRTVPSYTFHDKLASLFEIDLSWNEINRIRKFAFQAPNLQILDLTGNPLRNVEPRAIFTASLRFFAIVNDTAELTERCARAEPNDQLLSVYVNWYKRNGTSTRNQPIRFNKCLSGYVREKKIDLMIKKSKQVFGFYTLYIVLGGCLLSVFFGAMHYYRKNGLPAWQAFRRYKKLDRQGLVENAVEMDHRNREEDEIVMDLTEPPFNKKSGARTNV